MEVTRCAACDTTSYIVFYMESNIYPVSQASQTVKSCLGVRLT
jgi:hypothetical protein